MSYLVNLRIAGRPVLVVGAGTVAARKVSALLDADAQVTVVAPDVGVEVSALARAGRIRVVERAFGAQDVEGAFLVVGATDDDSVNRQVAEAAAASGALVNIVDRPELCAYTVPATVRRGHLTLAVATDGRCPTLARAIRERLERQFGPEVRGGPRPAGGGAQTPDGRGARIRSGWRSSCRAWSPPGSSMRWRPATRRARPRWSRPRLRLNAVTERVDTESRCRFKS